MCVRFICSGLFMCLLSVGVLAQDKAADSNTKGWELSIGAEGLSFYGTHEKGMDLSKNPFNEGRATVGAALSIGKWVTPTWMVRMKGSGYWGRALVSNLTEKNSSRFFSLQAEVMLDLLESVKGGNKTRRYGLLPFAGMGFSRNCSYDLNSISLSAGVRNQYRLNDLFSVFGELGWRMANHGKYNVPGYHLLSAEVGLSFHIGKVGKRVKNPNYIYQNYGKSDYRDVSRKVFPADTLAKVVLHKGVPDGMVLINRGSIMMGPDRRDTLMYLSNPSKQVSVDDFWMDATEVTNLMYRSFVQDVMAQTVESMVADKKDKTARKAAYDALFVTDPTTNSRSLDESKLFYSYQWYDEQSAIAALALKDKEGLIVRKDTAWVDDEGRIVKRSLQKRWTGNEDFVHTYIVPVLPDTTAWVTDFPQSDMLLYTKYYFWHKDYDNYPVVGVSWEQARAFCAWRTEKRKMELGGSLGLEEPFRLPTEAEWELAARVTSERSFPWSHEISARHREFLYANFQPAEGDFILDGNMITAKVGSYPCNENGLYDMAGNVAEWTDTPYTDMGVEGMNSINPNLVGADDMKCVKGGSWKDPLRFIQSTERKSYHKGEQHAFIGFRCVRSISIKPTQKTIIIK